MKTPKRHIELTTMIHDGLEMVWENSQWNVSTQRWKRKNRTAQLKRSLTRYKNATNLQKYSHELRAYKLLQHLKKPGGKSTMFDWTSYISRLQEITFQMERALIAACISAGQHLEKRKNAHKTAESGQQTDLPPTGGQQTTQP